MICMEQIRKNVQRLYFINYHLKKNNIIKQSFDGTFIIKYSNGIWSLSQSWSVMFSLLSEKPFEHYMKDYRVSHSFVMI